MQIAGRRHAEHLADVHRIGCSTASMARGGSSLPITMSSTVIFCVANALKRSVKRLLDEGMAGDGAEDRTHQDAVVRVAGHGAP